MWVPRSGSGELQHREQHDFDGKCGPQRSYLGRGGTFPGSTVCNAQFHQSFAGFQVGQDVADLNVNGWNIHLGTTAGFLETTGNIVGGNVAGGYFNSTTEAPFIGTYGVATYGSFYVDGLIRYDYFQTQLNSPTVNLFNQSVDAHGFTVSASTGYNYKVPNSELVRRTQRSAWSGRENRSIRSMRRTRQFRLDLRDRRDDAFFRNRKYVNDPQLHPGAGWRSRRDDAQVVATSCSSRSLP